MLVDDTLNPDVRGGNILNSEFKSIGDIQVVATSFGEKFFILRI